MTLFLMLMTKLDAPVIEDALSKYSKNSAKKTFGIARAYWEKVTTGIYLVVTEYRGQTGFADDKLRSGLQEGLRKMDSSGEVIRIETKKRLEVEKDVRTEKEE